MEVFVVYLCIIVFDIAMGFFVAWLNGEVVKSDDFLWMIGLPIIPIVNVVYGLFTIVWVATTFSDSKKVIFDFRPAREKAKDYQKFGEE